MHNFKIENILRWGFFLPISWLCGALVILLFDILELFDRDYGALYTYTTGVSAYMFSGAAIVYIGSYVAPSHEKNVAIFYTVITLGIFIVNLTGPYFFPGYLFSRFNPDYHSLLSNLTYAAQDAGMYYMAWKIYQGKVVFDR